ncbi:hypothetical protein niasHT_017059 [Heterodera trifolii]|uniref:Uncharacterized protein n=1 Tax=Heterodera trifolii TaxID=157864 RepID=A0ABD2KXY2_9BILA
MRKKKSDRRAGNDQRRGKVIGGHKEIDRIREQSDGRSEGQLLKEKEDAANANDRAELLEKNEKQRKGGRTTAAFGVLPNWVKIWLVCSTLICSVDVAFTALRPESLRGGKYDNFFTLCVCYG